MSPEKAKKQPSIKSRSKISISVFYVAEIMVVEPLLKIPLSFHKLTISSVPSSVFSLRGFKSNGGTVSYIPIKQKKALCD